MYRTDGSLQWYASMKQSDMTSCSNDIRELTNIKIQILDTYRRYDRAKYKAFMDNIFNQTEVFMNNRVSFGERSHPLDHLMQMTMRGALLSEDSVMKKEDEALMERTAELMHKYSPELLQKYYNTK